MVKRKMKKLICRADGKGGWLPLAKGRALQASRTTALFQLHGNAIESQT